MAILIKEPDEFPEAAIELLREYGDVCLAGESFDAATIEVIFVRLAERLDARLSARFPNLRCIVTPTTGLNHVDLEHFEALGVEVLSLRGRTSFLDSIRATAEHTLALVLALIRHVPQAAQHTRQGGWDRYPFKGTELHGKRVLLLGYGRIGRQLEQLYGAFGCQVVAHDVDPSKVPAHLRCDFPAALARTDLLSIHVNLVPETHGLVDARLLSMLPRHAFLVNTARGEIVDQKALLTLLRDGRLAGAALDVLRAEPEPFDAETAALVAEIDERRLLLTPHIGGFTQESLDKVEVHMAQVLVDHLAHMSQRALATGDRDGVRE
jgi:D-3-phosphoglycerate dehydrogenase / 2-oxoglutarate reductase